MLLKVSYVRQTLNNISYLNKSRPTQNTVQRHITSMYQFSWTSNGLLSKLSSELTETVGKMVEKLFARALV